MTTCRAGAPRTSAGSKAGSKPSPAKALPKVAGGVLGGLLSAGAAHAEKYVMSGGSAAVKAAPAAVAAPAAASTSLPSLPAVPSVSLPSVPSIELPSVDLPSLPSVELPSDLLDSLAQLNPLLLAGAGVLLVGLPLAAKALSAPAPKVLGVSPGTALEALTDDPRTLLVDIRSKEAAKAEGSPDLSGARKKAFSLPLIQVGGVVGLAGVLCCAVNCAARLACQGGGAVAAALAPPLLPLLRGATVYLSASAVPLCCCARPTKIGGEGRGQRGRGLWREGGPPAQGGRRLPRHHHRRVSQQ